MTVHYEKFPYKYRVAARQPNGDDCVSYRTFVVGYVATIYDPLMLTLWAHLHADGVLVIFQGAPWDGPSGPALDTETFMDASLAHDYLYRCMELGKVPHSQRSNADRTMRAIAKSHGMGWFRRAYTFIAVRLGGGSHARLKATKP